MKESSVNVTTSNCTGTYNWHSSVRPRIYLQKHCQQAARALCKSIRYFRFLFIKFNAIIRTRYTPDSLLLRLPPAVSQSVDNTCCLPVSLPKNKIKKFSSAKMWRGLQVHLQEGNISTERRGTARQCEYGPRPAFFPQPLIRSPIVPKTTIITPKQPP